MTGQVKEDFLSRFAELGVIVEEGIISFNPGLINHSEFLKQEQSFVYYDKNGTKKTISLPNLPKFSV